MGMFLKQNIINKVVEFNNIHKQLDAEQLNMVAERVGHIAQFIPEQELTIDGVNIITPIVTVAVKSNTMSDEVVDGINYDVMSMETVELVILNSVLTWVTRTCDFYFKPDEEDVAFTKNDVINTVDIATLSGYNLYGTV